MHKPRVLVTKNKYTKNEPIINYARDEFLFQCLHNQVQKKPTKSSKRKKTTTSDCRNALGCQITFGTMLETVLLMLFYSEALSTNILRRLSALEASKTQPLEIEYRAVSLDIEGVEKDQEKLKNVMSRLLLHEDVQLVHGTKANLILPMIKRTQYQMLNVLDLLEHGSCPMVGELENGIQFDDGVNLERLDFDELENGRWNYWAYALAKYPDQDSNLNDRLRLIDTPGIKKSIYKICDEIMDGDKQWKDDLLVKLSIAVMRLKLFDPTELIADVALLERIARSRKVCFEYVERYINDLQESIGLCDQTDLKVHPDTLSSRWKQDEQQDMKIWNDIMFLFQTKLNSKKFERIDKDQPFKAYFHDVSIALKRNGHHENFLRDLVGVGQLKPEEITFGVYLKDPRTRLPISDSKELHLNAQELTIVLRSYPGLFSREPTRDATEDWRKLLENTLKLQKKRYLIFKQASDPHIKADVPPLSEFEKQFMNENDIPMVVGLKANIPEKERNHLRFGQEINVILIKAENLEIFRAYIDEEFKDCSGKLKVLVVAQEE